MNKVSTIVFFALGAVAVIGAYFYPQVPGIFGTSSSVGTTFLTQKYAAINWTLSTGATSTSILNGDATDRVATNLQYVCTGVGSSNTAYTGTGLASVTLKAATTSTSAPANVSNTNLLVSGTLATSSVVTVVSSSTLVVGGTSINAIWPSGSYLTFFTNATNTAACTMGVQYIGT